MKMVMMHRFVRRADGMAESDNDVERLLNDDMQGTPLACPPDELARGDDTLTVTVTALLMGYMLIENVRTREAALSLATVGGSSLEKLLAPHDDAFKPVVERLMRSALRRWVFEAWEAPNP